MDKCAVLIVEGEYLIRAHAAEIINDAGYEVVEATNTDEAIAILESRPDIRVVFSDIHMPDKANGLKLTHAIRDRWPDIYIIATGSHNSAKCSPLLICTISTIPILSCCPISAPVSLMRCAPSDF